jgi:hypothetical protein
MSSDSNCGIRDRQIIRRLCYLHQVIGRYVLIRKQWPAFILAFLLPLVAVYWWWGGFNAATVSEAESGPYFYAYVEHEGDLGKLSKTQARVFALLEQAGIEPGDTVTVLLTDPRKRVVAAKVHAAVILAPSKAYQALADYLKPMGRDITLPAVEIYRPSGTPARVGELTVEVAAP